MPTHRPFLTATEIGVIEDQLRKAAANAAYIITEMRKYGVPEVRISWSAADSERMSKLSKALSHAVFDVDPQIAEFRLGRKSHEATAAKRSKRAIERRKEKSAESQVDKPRKPQR